MSRCGRGRGAGLAAVLVAAASVALPARAGVESELPSPARLAAVRAYIKKSWTTLSRSLREWRKCVRT